MEVGRRLCDRYVLERELGRGGMGVVFAARDEVLGREVAIKLISDRSDRDRLELGLRREAQLIAGLDHPNIVPVFDFGRDDDLLFLVMPLLRGRTLRELLASGPLELPLAAEVGRQIALGLAHSHAQGIIHRDIKPDNVMLVSDPSGPLIKLMDFGLALVGREGETLGRVVGTLRYLAPEQARGERVDARTDLHALGVLLYEALIGRPPFGGSERERESELLNAIISATPIRAGLLRPDLPEAIEVLLQQLLAKHPDERPASALEVAARLAEFADAQAARVLLDASSMSGEAGSGGSPEARTAVLRGAIGRGEVLRSIDARLTAARAGVMQLVLVAGEHGIGKTTVLTEVEQLGRAREALYVRVGAPANGAWGPREAFIELFREAARAVATPEQVATDEGAWPSVLAAVPGLPPALGEVAADLLALVPELADVLGGQIQPSASVRDPQGRLDELMVRCFAAIARARGLLILALDDLELAPAALELVELLFRRLAKAPLLLVVAHEQPTLVPDHPLRRLHLRLAEHPRVLALELGRLPVHVHDELIVQLLGGGEPEPGLAERLYREGGGHPLYARELVRAAVEAGVLVQRDRVWRLDAAVWPVPRNLRLAIINELRSLPESLRSLLRTAAVLAVGDHGFEFDELAELHGGERHELEAEIEQALELALLTERRIRGRTRLVFASELLRRVVHADVPVSARRKLHHHCADRLRRQQRNHDGTPVDHRSSDAILLAHLLEAEALVEARPLVLALAQQALDELQPQLARPSLATMLEAGDALPLAERAELRLLAAELDTLRGEQQAVVTGLQMLASELDAGLERGDDPRLHRFGERGAELARALGRNDLADRLLGLRSRDRRGGGSDRERRVRAQVASLRPATSSQSMAVGDLLLMHGEYTAARAAYESARRRAAAEGQHDEEARQLQKLARVASKLGLYDSALAYCREGLELLDGEHSLERVGLWALAAYCHCVAGELDRAAAELEAGSAELASFPDDGRNPAHQRVASELARTRGNWLMARGRPEQAVAAYERSLALLSSNDRWTLSIARFSLGEACALAGFVHRALRELERAATDKRALGDRWGLAHTHAVRSRVLRDLGLIREAAESLDEARDLADEVDDPRLFALVHIEIARHRLLAGALTFADVEARQAHEVARTCSAVAELAEASELIAAVALIRGDLEVARRYSEEAVAEAELHSLGAVLVGALLVLAEATPANERSVVLEQARAAAEELGNPYRELDVELTRLRLAIRTGSRPNAGDDYVALERLSERAEGLMASRHVGLCLLAQAEVLRPHDPRGALDHARLAEGRLRSLGALREAELASVLIDGLLRHE